MRIRPETVDDFQAVGALLIAAFAGDAEAKLVDALRRDGDATCALVAIVDDCIAGHILFSPLVIEGVTSAVALAPLAVAQVHRRRGVGEALVRAGLDECRRLGFEAVVVLGDPDYYGRFGFSAAKAAALTGPYAGEHLQALELVPGSMRAARGEPRYARAFAEL